MGAWFEVNKTKTFAVLCSDSHPGPSRSLVWVQVCSNYEKHREVIVEDILSLFSKLPTSKRNLRNYKYASFISRFVVPCLDYCW